MQYTSLKEKELKVKHIEAPSTGIITGKRPCNIGEVCLENAKNMIYSVGVLSSRGGLYTKEDGFLDVSAVGYAESYKYFFTDYEVSIEGELCKIARVDALCDNSAYFVFVFGIDKNQNIKALGKMYFNRVDDTTFYCPENIVFYSGKAVNGGGVFAMVTLKNAENSTDAEYAVYEIDSSFVTWNYASEYYIPTVYINGRGNAYYTLDWSFNSKPQSVENRNFLEGNFYAYYSSDGASYSFRLPFTDIDNSAIKCRIYQSIDSFTEWTVYEDETSDKKTFLDKEVTLSVDRKKGIVSFFVENGAYAIPIIGSYNENNIRIMARKNIENGFDSVVSCKCALKNGERTVFSGGVNGNRIYYAEYETPLYFPQVFDNEIGMPNQAVTGLKAIEDRIIAFKLNEAYEIAVKNSGYFNTASLLADNGIFFRNTDTFTVKNLGGGTGCCDNTASVVGGNIMWLAPDGDIHLLKRGSLATERVSVKAEKLLDKLTKGNKIYSVGVGENYILCSACEAIIINAEGDCYYWEFPEGIIIEGLASIGNSILFMYRYNNSKYSYIAGLYGEQDVIISENGNDRTLLTLPIVSELTLDCSHLGSLSSRKSIKSVDFNMELKEKCKITVGDGRVFATTCIEQPKELKDSVRFITDIMGVKSVMINISCDSCITFGGADIYYTV